MAMVFRAIRRRFYVPDVDEARDLRTYRTATDPSLDKVVAIREAWLGALEHESDNERLANLAAVSRWEAGRLVEHLEAVQPPSVLSADHREVMEALGELCRAMQLLANGKRFHKMDAVCDGQMLLIDAVKQIERTRQGWDELISRARD